VLGGTIRCKVCIIGTGALHLYEYEMLKKQLAMKNTFFIVLSAQSVFNLGETTHITINIDDAINRIYSLQPAILTQFWHAY
jgi:hypothetical protein